MTNGRTSVSCGLELVVVRPRLELRSEREAPSWNVDLVRPGRGTIGARRRRNRIRAPGAKLQRSSIASCEELVLHDEPEREAPRRTSALGLSRSTCSSRSSARSRTSVAYARTGSARKVGRRRPFRRARRMASYTSRCTSRIGGAPPRYRRSRAPRSTRCARGSRPGVARAARSAPRARRRRSAEHRLGRLGRARSMSCRISTRGDTLALSPTERLLAMAKRGTAR